MISSYFDEYFTPLLSSLSDNVINNVVGLVSGLVVYIPIHFLFKWLIGEKNSRYAFIAYIFTLVVTLTGIFLGA